MESCHQRNWLQNQIQVDNNQIQIDFQQQLNQDLEPQANAENNQAEVEAQKSVEKDPPEDEGVQP